MRRGTRLLLPCLAAPPRRLSSREITVDLIGGYEKGRYDEKRPRPGRGRSLGGRLRNESISRGDS